MSISHDLPESNSGFGTTPPADLQPRYQLASSLDAGVYLLGLREVDRSSARRAGAYYAFGARDSSAAVSPDLHVLPALSDELGAGAPSGYGGQLPIRCWAEPTARAPLNERIDCLCRSAAEEYFEPGVESRFAKCLQALVGYYGSSVLRCLKTRLEERSVSAPVLSEMIEWASWQDDPAMRLSVIDFLSAGMNHESALVRDEATLGMAHLEGERAIGALEEALEREKDPDLRQDMADLIASLKE